MTSLSIRGAHSMLFIVSIVMPVALRHGRGLLACGYALWWSLSRFTQQTIAGRLQRMLSRFILINAYV